MDQTRSEFISPQQPNHPCVSLAADLESYQHNMTPYKVMQRLLLDIKHKELQFFVIFFWTLKLQVMSSSPYWWCLQKTLEENVSLGSNLASAKDGLLLPLYIFSSDSQDRDESLESAPPPRRSERRYVKLLVHVQLSLMSDAAVLPAQPSFFGQMGRAGQAGQVAGQV